MDGILVIDKPEGFTSHDVVARVRRALKEKRVGHTGTLDPFATGVLVILVGQATRLAQFLSGANKEYEGVIRFGFATDTGDSTGAIKLETKSVLSSKEFAKLWDALTIENALAPLRGKIGQIPPMYSAKKVKGKKLYELARKGEEVERAMVEVVIHELEKKETEGANLLHDADGTCDMAIRVVCSAGTYIRTLAESIGEQLGVAAHLKSLRRTRAGNFEIKTARTLAELDQFIGSGGDINTWITPMRAALSAMPATTLEDETARRVSHGATVPVADALQDGEMVQMCDRSNKLIAIGVYDMLQKALHPRVVFVTND